MKVDRKALREAAEKATPGRIGDRIDGSGSIKYQCFGSDGSLVLQTDHKNMEYGFIGKNSAADELLFRLCEPDTVLALLDELEVSTNACNGWQRKFAEADERLQAAERRLAELCGILASARIFISDYAGLGDVGAAEFLTMLDRVAGIGNG